MDVIGDDRERCRPPRWLWALLSALALVGLSAGAVVEHQRRSRDQDRQSLRQLDLDVDEEGSAATADGLMVPLRIQNLSAAGVHILGSSAVGPLMSVHLSVRSGADVTVPVRLQPCPTTVPTAGPAAVTLAVETSRGQRTSYAVDTTGTAFASSYLALEERTCGLYPLTESVVATVISQAVSRSALVVSLRVHNQSKRALVLDTMTAGRGYQVVTDLPVALGGEASRTVPLRVVVDSCSSTQEITDVPRVSSMIDFGDLLASVSDGPTQTSTEIRIGPAGLDLLDLVEQTCPHR